MRAARHAALAVLLAAPTATALPAIEAPKAEAPISPTLRIPGRVLVRLKTTTPAKPSPLVDEAALKALGARHGLTFTLVKRSILDWLVVDMRFIDAPTRVPDEDETLAIIERLATDDAFADVSENRWARALATPNDPSFGDMWHLTAANLPAAWDDEQGNANQRVGVIDTGLLRGHEDVGSKAVVGYDFITNATTAGDGTARDDDFQDAGDACGGSSNSFHGTHVAGTIAASTNNGTGISGVNWNARLAIVRALGRCGGDIVDIMEGALWLSGGQVNGVPSIGADRVGVINFSLGSRSGCTSFEQSTINTIDAAGVVVVAAAGNDGGAVNSPSNCQNVVSVAAHGPTKSLAPYSSFGSQVDIVAPGGDLRNFGNAGGVISALGPSNNTYGFYEGTSMAAPHVAGVVSLMQAKDPSVNRAKAEQALIASGQACTNCGGKLALNAAGALAQLVRGGTPVDPPPDPPPPASDDAFEDNDTAAVAKRLRCGDTHNLQAGARDQDWFFVDVDVGPMNVAINGGATDLDLYIVRDGTEILLQSQGSTGVEALAAEVTRAQRLEILVNPFANETTAASGPYSLTLTCTGAADTPPVDPSEPPPTDPAPTDPPTEPGEPGDPTEPEPTEPSDDDDAGLTGGRAPVATGGCAQASTSSLSLLALAALLGLRRRQRR